MWSLGSGQLARRLKVKENRKKQLRIAGEPSNVVLPSMRDTREKRRTAICFGDVGGDPRHVLSSNCGVNISAVEPLCMWDCPCKMARDCLFGH